ncbi:hypothetical protein CONCODRAFT_87357 [Conidiobolus coronatus NRRL 28638]|uniref:HIT-type domain-containing protein n=1 Tax=Conidiobolus coronatus (strain ATCC 28846 / CBS 209.66 / NRRL 28638) TaxID=796925 RepID=A0A137NVI8_CONC2|nr:hypothetical protein CONCODRAFT_87357 [Conidiobolus coronatus NRRL 28638]|eukprot:KXN66671.1 hypothetical protein CONCODRAFT_87357 [Conidiobolus coronatus NRRL 28638]
MKQIICSICKLENKKYKCPNCSLPYCSLNCYKTHQEYCNKLKSETTATETKTTPASQYPSTLPIYENIEDEREQIPIAKLTELLNNEQLQQDLKKPGVKENLLKLIHSKAPLKEIQKCLRNTEDNFLVQDVMGEILMQMRKD